MLSHVCTHVYLCWVDSFVVPSMYCVLHAGMWDHCFEESLFLPYIRVMEVDCGSSLRYFVGAMRAQRLLTTSKWLTWIHTHLFLTLFSSISMQSQELELLKRLRSCFFFFLFLGGGKLAHITGVKRDHFAAEFDL